MKSPWRGDLVLCHGKNVNVSQTLAIISGKMGIYLVYW